MFDLVWSRAVGCSALFYLSIMSVTEAAPARHPCAGVADDFERLACYDAEFGLPELETAVLAGSSTSAQSASVAVVREAWPTEPSGASLKSRTRIDASTSTDEDFGLSKWTKGSLDPEAARAQPQRLRARVRKVTRQRDGRFEVTLDNEQVWRQTESESRAIVAEGDEVTIREASLGSYLLVTSGRVATRVRRAR
jgi:hypothetical protein